MDEYKFKPLEDWIKKAKQGNCDQFFALAYDNNDHKLCATVQTDFDSMVEMLLTVCCKNNGIASAITSVADLINYKATGCHNCQHAGTIGGNENDHVAVAHCTIHKETHRLPHSCDDWKQREEKGGVK